MSRLRAKIPAMPGPRPTTLFVAWLVGRNEDGNSCGDGSSRQGRDERAQSARLRRLPRTPGGTTRGTVTTE
jgi:hypothetical protein